MALMQYTIFLAAVNVVMLLLIAIPYLKNLKLIKSKFTIGLFLFIFVFLIQNLIAIYFFVTMMELYSPGTDLTVFVLTLLQTIAFGLYLSLSRI